VALITLARDLRRRKARDRTGSFVAEGVRTVEELLRSPLAVEGALVSPQLAASPRGGALRDLLAARQVPVVEVDETDFASAADTESPQGVLAVAAIPERTWGDLPSGGAIHVLVLDAVQDPGNVGTMLRTAAALGASATVTLAGTVDLWNAKVVRSAMGAHFAHPAFATSWEDLDQWRLANHVSLWGADAHGSPLPTRPADVPPRLALVLGNEGSGLTPGARSRIERSVALPLVDVESLNVAVAAGILLYTLLHTLHANPDAPSGVNPTPKGHA
jgi:RNA methyltransferase, TrmH family